MCGATWILQYNRHLLSPVEEFGEVEQLFVKLLIALNFLQTTGKLANSTSNVKKRDKSGENR